MVKQSDPDDVVPSLESLFPPNEGNRATLGVNFPRSIAAAIRRRGNLRKSISEEIRAMIDPAKLQALLRADADHQAKCSNRN